MKACIICDIVSAKVPAWIVYQATDIICFLPKAMEAYGHTLIAPTVHYDDIYTAPENMLSVIMTTAQKLARHFQQRLGASGINLLHASGVAAQQSVCHLHVHLIPRFEHDGLDAWPKLPAGQYDKDEVLQRLRLSS